MTIGKRKWLVVGAVWWVHNLTTACEFKTNFNDAWKSWKNVQNHFTAEFESDSARNSKSFSESFEGRFEKVLKALKLSNFDFAVDKQSLSLHLVTSGKVWKTPRSKNVIIWHDVMSKENIQLMKMCRKFSCVG